MARLSKKKASHTFYTDLAKKAEKTVTNLKAKVTATQELFQRGN